MLIYINAFLLIIFLTMVIVMAMRPIVSNLSVYELQRRAEAMDRAAKKQLKSIQMESDIVALKQLVFLILLTVLSITTAMNYEIWTLVFVLVATVMAGLLSTTGYVQALAAKLYKRIEKHIFRFIKKAPLLFALIKIDIYGNVKQQHKLGSVQELSHIVDESEDVFSDEVKQLVSGSLQFFDKKIRDIMIPRDKIVTVPKSEFLGPLTLDELHRVGHDVLPVIDGDIDHIVGILNLKYLLNLEVKKSSTAEKVMEPKVYYINQNQDIGKALAAFLETHHHLLIVVNKSRETVGMITMSDIVEALFGRRITDDFDAYDSLVVVANTK